jgi:UDP-N-acetylmuramate dehydrogenase
MASLNSHAKDLSRFWRGEILWDCPMSRFSTLKVGGPAEAIIFAKSLEELKGLVQWLHGNNIHWRVIGRGSNILVPDEGLTGVVIFLEKMFSEIDLLTNAEKAEVGDKVLIRVGGGCSLSKLVRFCSANGLTGLEFAIGIPGSVGGAIVMNAGAWGHEIGGFIDTVDLMNERGNITSMNSEDLGLSYRQWEMAHGTILLFSTFILNKGEQTEIEEKCKRYQEVRKQNQPLGAPSVGSFFKNPPQQPAGKLIEEAGLKGHRVGGAMISDQHANFVVNIGNASANDIITLMQDVQAKVFERFGIKLEPEVHILGIKENQI